MVPKDSVSGFLKGSWEECPEYRSVREKNMVPVIGYLAKSLLHSPSMHSPSNQCLTKTFKDACQKIWTEEIPRYQTRTVLPEPVITKVLQAAIKLKDQYFINDVAKYQGGNLSLDFFKWAKEQIAAGDIDFDTIKDR